MRRRLGFIVLLLLSGLRLYSQFQPRTYDVVDSEYGISEATLGDIRIGDIVDFGYLFNNNDIL